MQRKRWIDIARGLCMVAILYDHTEVYYTADNIIPYRLYVTNALVAFYLISGYLFYHPQTFPLKRKIFSIFKSLVKLYFIFTLFMAIPKVWVHHGELSLTEAVANIFLGKASWFVAALIVAEIIFSVFLHVSKGKTWALSILSISCLPLSILLSIRQASYPWQLNNALQAVFFLFIGYLFHKGEKTFRHLETPFYTIMACVLLALTKTYERVTDMQQYISPIVIDNYLIFLIDVLLSAWLLMRLCQWLERQYTFPLLTFTGKHSIIYYFLCGGVPMLVSMALGKVGWAYNGSYWLVPIAFAIVYAVATAITAIYLSFTSR